MSDILELVDLEELVDEKEIYCESQWHGPVQTKKSWHADGGPFWWVNFTKSCHCGFTGVEIRCDSWSQMIMRNPPERIYHCSCGGSYQVVVLSKINDG